MTQQAEQTKIKPLSDRVLVQRFAAADTAKGGIILPDSAKQKQETAKVIAVGEGKKTSKGELISMPVKAGDVVLLDQYGGQTIEVDGEEYLILRADEIIAIVA